MHFLYISYDIIIIIDYRGKYVKLIHFKQTYYLIQPIFFIPLIFVRNSYNKEQLDCTFFLIYDMYFETEKVYNKKVIE
jgi:hypothetical protein